ncbi:nuclear transport factor 2-like isoform X2 [Impatiens glandulifera]|uniref:nuclear transport factor 2-like isoform X2 n=1 Tax=Impatiens glandulifera TaxID=253017 RepID=UPI001FB1078D|nr:nuclear transport factor 2-like isoform X2 [Impatiens glandulifera]
MEDPIERLTASSVAYCFTFWYYQLLHTDPAKSYRFYNDISQLSRTDENGNMSVTTTLKGIKEKILSVNYTNFESWIRWVDGQESIDNGFQIFVTGFLRGMNHNRYFIQVFFLAPQERGYFILNDIFRFLDQDSSPVPANKQTVAPIEINVDKIVDNVETVVNEEEIQLVDEVPNVKTVVDAKEITLLEFVDEVPNVEIVADKEDVLPVNVVHQVPNVETVVDAKEIPLAEVVHEVHDDSYLVGAKEIPLTKVVDEVYNIKIMVDAKEVPLVEVVDEVPNVETVVDAKEISLNKVVDEVYSIKTMVDAEEVPLVEVVDQVPNEETMVDAEEVPLLEVVDNVRDIYCDVDAKEVALGNVVDEVSDDSCLDDAKEGLLAKVVDKVPHYSCVVDAKEFPPAKVVDQVHDDCRVVEPKEVPFSKIGHEVPYHSCVIEPESKIEEMPKKSHASIENEATLSSHAPAPDGIEPKIEEHQVSHLQPSISEAEAAGDYSIYIKYLPVSVTTSILEDEFKRFGAIKEGGVQFQKNKQGFFFGFVRFEEANSVQKAVEASPVWIAGRQIVVEEKSSSNSRGGSGSHRFRHDVRGGHSGSPIGGRRRGRFDGLLR